MRERLIQYVDLLFAGASGAEEMKQEILHNTLDRFDDLVSQGKTEEAAYRLAISGIGDISELLSPSAPAPAESVQIKDKPIHSRRLRAAAIAMFITCAIPLFILSEFGLETIGLCLTLLLVAAATSLLIMSGKQEETTAKVKSIDPRKKRLKQIILLPSLAVWLLLSIITQAWFITWLIFPIAGCIKGLVIAIMDLKEENIYEN